MPLTRAASANSPTAVGTAVPENELLRPIFCHQHFFATQILQPDLTLHAFVRNDDIVVVGSAKGSENDAN